MHIPNDTAGVYVPTKGLISEELLQQYIAVLSMVAGLVAGCGILANIVNVVVFSKQGLKDSTTLSLFSLSVSDLLVVVTSLFMCVSMSVRVVHVAGVVVRMVDLYYKVASLNIAFARISGCLAATVSVERCLAVTMPLQFKDLVTPAKILAAIAVYFFINMLSSLPIFYIRPISLVFDEILNQTVTITLWPKGMTVFRNLMFILGVGTVLPVFLLVNIVFTTILAINLRKKSKWQIARSGIEHDKVERKRTDLGKKDTHVAKMVISVSVLNIACFIPILVYVFVKMFVPSLGAGQREENLDVLISQNLSFIQTVNSSFNIFIYMSMNSTYRKTFLKFFGIMESAKS